MTETYHSARGDEIARLLAAIMMLDAAFSLVILMWWRQMAVILVDPMRWASWTPISPTPEIYEYPFIMIWGLPLVGIAGAYLLKSGGAWRAAVGVASFPLLYLGSLIGCYYTLPMLLGTAS